MKMLNFAGPSGFYFAAKTDQPIMPPDVLAAAQSPGGRALARRERRSCGSSSATRRPSRRRSISCATELAAVRSERTDVDTAVATTLIFREMATPKPAYILNRGEYDQHGAEVDAADAGDAAADGSRGAEQPLGPRPVARLARESAHRARGGQPLLAAVLRHRAW